MPSTLRRLAALSVVVELLLARCPGVHAAPTRVVVFVAPAAGELPDALRDALSAQLAGADTELRFERFSSDASTLRRQATEARTLAAADHALGVFWLDAPADKDWLLYLAEPGGDRVLVRRVTVEAGGVAAATEAVSVITSESSVALARGQTIGMQPVALPPEPPPPSPPSAGTAPPPPAGPASPPARPAPGPETPSAGRWFAGLAYYGDGLAKEIRWQSGARLSLGVHLPHGLYLNAGYVFLKEATVRGAALTFQIARNPLDIGLGIALGRNRWRPSLEVRGLVEVLSRQSIATGTELEATPTATRVMIFVSPRARLDCTISQGLGAYAAVGIDVATNPFFYVSRVGGQDQPLLRPSAVRPAIELGASFAL